MQEDGKSRVMSRGVLLASNVGKTYWDCLVFFRHDELTTRALFSSPQKAKSFQDFLSNQILRHMHRVLNKDENKN